MHRLLTISLVLAATLFQFACSNSNEPSNTDNDASSLKMGEIKCNVDGKSWTSMNALAIKSPATVNIAGATYNLGTGLSEQLAIVITGELKTGSIGQLSIGSFQRTNVATQATDSYDAPSPTCQITTVTDTEVAGSFSFKGTNKDGKSVNVTSGVFRCKLQ